MDTTSTTTSKKKENGLKLSLRSPSYRSKFFRFPEKLFKVTNDSLIIRWTEDGYGILIEEFHYESHVMDLYPGFVQVGTFHNLRRLLRDYGFEFVVLRRRHGLSDLGMKLEYRHPLFTRDSTMLDLFQIVKIKEDLNADERNDILANFTNSNQSESKSPLLKSKLKRYQECSLKLIQKFNQKSASIDFRDCNDSLRGGDARTNYSQLEPNILFDKTVNSRRALDKEVENARYKSTGSNSGLSKLCDSKLHLLQIYGRNELDEPEFAELMMSQLSERYDKVSADTWEATLYKVNDLMSSDTIPSHDSINFVPVSYENL